MVAFNFEREFRHWVRKARARCLLCKALTLIVHKPGVADVDEETARAATLAGAGAPLAPLPGNDAP